MMRTLAEANFEDDVLETLSNNGWDIHYAFNRLNFNNAIDFKTLKEKIMTINNVTESNAEKALIEIKKISGSAVERNVLGTKFLIEGVKIFDDSVKRNINIKLVDIINSQNHYGVIRQLPMIDVNGKERYPDIVCFINGLPIIVMELKAPDANERLPEAFKQQDSLKRQFPSLYTFNVFDFLSNNIESKYGSITSPFKKYFNAGKWTQDENPISKICNKDIIWKFIHQYSFFNNDNTIKYIAALHQVEAVESTIIKMKEGDHKGGVVWHTQGSGKSITMLMLTKAILGTFATATTLVVTDRNSLDRQLFGNFSGCSDYLMSKPIEVDSRKDLIQKLNDKKHFGVYFTTVQKFSSETGSLSNRDDIFILIDEAHRSQNNIEGERKLNKETQEFIMTFGFAKFMRDAFPNAVLTGFTGTPLMGDKMTTDIFGGYNHKYSMNDSVADGSTVPIFYESRKVEIKLHEDYLELMDQIQHTYAKTLDANDVQSEDKMKSLLKTVQAKKILEDPDVVEAKVKDILKHLSIRKNVLHGKAMIVASSRKSAFEYYKAIIDQEPERRKSTILVMTHNNKDEKHEEQMIVPKHQINEVAAEFRKPNSIYKIAIVVDMWLTGFDVPDLDVMYIDKVIKWHNLMQAIARVNRVYEDKEKVKESGLVVDYLGIWKYLSDALAQYANGNNEAVDIIPEDIEKAREKLLDELEIINNNFIPGVKEFSKLDSKEQYTFIMNGLNIVLSFDKTKKNAFILKARALNRLMKIVFTSIDKGLSTAIKAIQVINSLLSTHNTQDDEELRITIDKITEAIESAVDAEKSDIFIRSTQINKDINKVAELLEEEASQLKENNPQVAKKLLEDAINGRIAELKKYRPIFSKKASDKLREILMKLEKDENINKVVEMLIVLSKEIKDKMLEDPEFSDPHLQAFFTILAEDEFLSHNQNSEVLKAIAEDLMTVIKENITDQFYINKKVKKIVGLELKKILKNKYNYPPDQLGGLSKILIDRINDTISFNSEYFVDKKEVV